MHFNLLDKKIIYKQPKGDNVAYVYMNKYCTACDKKGKKEKN